MYSFLPALPGLPIAIQSVSVERSDIQRFVTTYARTTHGCATAEPDSGKLPHRAR
ncbi:Uncharacterised protein [Mycobacteroides abscessus subsp. abscessus]|nr:Uncharacterised protein [Mycobacteroides abscessus subsp. abscessus]